MALKYGPLSASPKGRHYPVAASQYFYGAGGAFVYLDSSGHVTLALTATATLFGYAIPPKETDSLGYWLSSSTAGADTVFVCTDLMEEYVVPSDATITQSLVGNAADLIGVNDGTAQTADSGTTSTDVLLIKALAVGEIPGAAATDVIVSINPAKVQADT